jgi:hypothetical protein
MNYRLLQAVGVIVCFVFAGFGFAQLDTPRIESYGLFAVNGSGVNGNMQVMTEGNRVKITTTIYAMQPGVRHAVALFEGDCGPDRTQVARLETVPNLEGDLYSSITYTSIAFEQITGGNHFAYVYATDEVNQANIVACGEVGLGANASATTTQPTDMTTTTATTEMTTEMASAESTAEMSSTEVTTTESGAGPNDALRTTSYNLFPLDGSGMSGKLQVQETVDMQVRATLTLSGVVEGYYYDAILFSGDCSPNGAEVLRLETVGESIPEDPFASLTFTAISYDTITTGNHFVMVFAKGTTSPALACGEVGVGANQ